MHKMHLLSIRLVSSLVLIIGTFAAAPLAHAEHGNSNDVTHRVSVGDGDHDADDRSQNKHKGDQHGPPSFVPGPPAFVPPVQRPAPPVVAPVSPPSAPAPVSQPAATVVSPSSTTSAIVTLPVPTTSSNGSGSRVKICDPLPDDRVNSGAADAMSFCLLPAEFPLSYLDYSTNAKWQDWYRSLGFTWLGWQLQPARQAVISLPAPTLPAANLAVEVQAAPMVDPVLDLQPALEEPDAAMGEDAAGSEVVTTEDGQMTVQPTDDQSLPDEGDPGA